MFRQKTTLVVGAGASCELGLPSGDGLKSQILTLLKPSTDNAYGFTDPIMIELMKRRVDPRLGDYPSKLDPVKQAGDRIRRGLPLALSIDNFLHSHQGDEEVEQLGKLAIAINIIRAEGGSHLFGRIPSMIRMQRPDAKPRMSIDGDGLAKSWYPAFAQQLMSGVQRHDISNAFANLRFVVFNYDRCLEQYLWMALQSYFDISRDEAAEVLSNVDFIHPYGDLGPLPWQHHDGPIALGNATIDDIPVMASRIRTFTESVRSDVGREVKDAMEWGDTLIILGFGYLDQNIQLLSVLPGKNGNRVFSTAYGVSDQDKLVMRDAMMALGGVVASSAMIEGGSCRDLFDNYRLHLSLR
ncbi:hypothetical protein [Sphingomonas kyungheensis]|uniref:SIR2-like domain-containing protein n=1 Tax=Sphingomonas kyungheensis TaxID=1069987 RepID=A0ABU8H7V7_9SPHN